MAKIKAILVSASILGGAALATMAGSQSASAANVTTYGLAFEAAYAADDACLSREGASYAGIRNNCAYAVEVVAWLPIVNEGWHDTRVQIYGNSSWCQTVTTNGVGNGAHIGPAVWTAAGPISWAILQTGWRYIWAESPLLFRCGLDSGEAIGMATATW